MAGDWIKMRTDLYRDPKVIVMAELLMSEESGIARYVNQHKQRDMSVTRNVMRNAVVGALVSVWGVARHQGRRVGDDLVIVGVTPNIVDDIADIEGFGEAMTAVEWLIETPQGVVFPRFFEENNRDPSEAKKEKNRERQRRYRERQSACNSNVTDSVTRNVTVTHRVEKSREENKEDNTPYSPPERKQQKRKTAANADRDYSPAFLEFWNAFPPTRKGSKPTAWHAWQTAILRATPEAIIAAAKEFALSDLAKSDYCPGPAPWLNQDRWDDDREAWKRRDGPQPTPTRRFETPMPDLARLTR